MKKITTTLTVLSLALSSVAFSVHAQNIATVNGKPVPKARVDALLNQVSKQAAMKGNAQPLPPQAETQAKDQVVMNEILVQEAEKRGLDKSVDFQQQMDIIRSNVLANLLFQDFEKKNSVSDAEVKAEYDKIKSQAGDKEYHAEHILVAKEEDAKALIAKLQKGAKFEELAKKESIDKASAVKGGDLDWSTPATYVPEFGKALTALKKGEMTKEPVKTQFGYHIIKLIDTRPVQFPSLETVKGQIKARMMQTKVIEFRDSLRDNAKTDYKFQAPAAVGQASQPQ